MNSLVSAFILQTLLLSASHAGSAPSFEVGRRVGSDRPPLTVKERMAAYHAFVRNLPPGEPAASDPNQKSRAQSWSAVTTTSAPVARSGHAAVWDTVGGRMLIWGGHTGSAYNQTGGRWTASAGTWATITTTGRPTTREGMAHCWSTTTSTMFVWGGSASDSFATVRNNGSRYDPAANSWTAVSTTSPPSGRGFATATAGSSSRIFVFGGVAVNNTWPATIGGIYTEPPTNTWAAFPTTNAPTVRVGHAAVWTGTELIIWGGYDSTNAYVNTGARYEPSGGTWTTMTTTGAPTGRANFAYTWTGSKLFVWGGINSGASYLGDGGLYDPSNNTWSSISSGLANSPSIRYEPVAVMGTNLVVVWGGTNVSGGANVMLNTGGLFDPVTPGWTATTLTSPPAARGSHSMVLRSGTQAVVWGGHNGTSTLNTGSQLTFP